MARKTIKAVSIGSHERSKLNDNFTELYAAPGLNTTATATEITRTCDTTGRIVPLTVATVLTMTEAAHEGRIVLLDRDAGASCILPIASGSGGRYRFVVKTALTGGGLYVISAGSSADTFVGTAHLAQDGGDTSVVFETASDSDTITLNLDTKGGKAGTYIELIDLAVGKYFVRVNGIASGTEATPFSAEV